MRLTVDLSPALAELIGRGPQRVRQAGSLGAKRAAEDYEQAIRDYIRAGQAFTPRTGHLEQSIGWRPDGDGAEVYANAPYAGAVERGTRPHRITPGPGRKALRWFPNGGGVAFARYVDHPGSRAYPYFFAERDQREALMLAAMREAVAETLLG
jgi:hypothetical protein